MKISALLITALALSLSGCSLNFSDDGAQKVKTNRMGILPEQTSQMIEQEWQVFKNKHPEMDETTARHEFDIIQVMSAEHYDADTAAWAERRVLANAWLKTQIEDVFNPNTINDQMVQAAIDAYAFQSGNPALVTASHILIRNDKFTSAQERKSALEGIRNDLIASGDLTNDALSREAQRLTKAGFRTDFNADLTFPRYAMTSFLGEQLPYRPVVEPFAAAAFALSEQNRLSPVTETEFGFHLILFNSKTQETKADPVKDRAFIVAKTVQQGRKLGTEQTLNQMMKDAEILVDEKRLQEIAGTHK